MSGTDDRERPLYYTHVGYTYCMYVSTAAVLRRTITMLSSTLNHTLST